MTSKEKLIFQLDKILNEIPKDFDFIDYVFVCSKSFECKILAYKGIQIYFDGRIKENTIYYMENPYFDFKKTMTPKTQAENLVDEYYQLLGEHIFNGHFDVAKDCALIAVSEILSETEERDGIRVINNPYWLEVKNEIEKL